MGSLGFILWEELDYAWEFNITYKLQSFYFPPTHLMSAMGLVCFQEEQQRIVLEHLLSSDRNSLLSEIQDLRAQLRMTHLQNQEKLQQLQETLTNAEDHGSKQEHQLRRKGST